MNNVYIYDSSQIHVYETEDFGSILDATTSTVDHGVNMFDFIVEDGTPGVMHDTFIVPAGQDYIVSEVTGSIDYEDVWITETTYPVSGNINLSGGEENAATVVFIATAEPIILRERAIVVRKQAWAGSGSLFEIGSGLERMVAPYIGGSGTLRLSGDATIASTSTYTDESSITYGSDLDHGQILAAVGSSHDYGQVDGVVDEGETDNGSVVDLGGSNPFGLFSFTGHISIPNRVKSYVGSGSFSVLSGGVDQLEEPTGSQTYIVGRNLATGQFIRRDVIGLRFHGGNPEAFARVGYQGSGVLFGLSGGQEAKVYDYTSDTVVTVNAPQDNGDIGIHPTTYTDYGQVSQSGYGQIDNGSVVITQTTGSAQGTLNVYGAAHSARSRDYTGSGSLTAAKHIDSYREGQSSQIAFIPHYRSRGGIHVTNHVVPDAFSRPYAGSGSLFKLGEKDESVTYDYTTESIVFVTDDIDNGSVVINAGDRVENYGSLTGVSIGVTDHGQVGITQTTPSFGFFKIGGGGHGAARSRDFVGSGQFKSYKGQAVVNAGQASDFAFLPHWRGRGGITLTNHVIPDAFVRTHVGSGSLFEIGQKDERVTFIYDIGSVAVSVTVPEIVLAPWNGTSAYTGSNISAVASGNGSGSSGGFNSSTTTYWRFTGQGSSNTSGTNPRILTLGQLDLTNYNQFEFTAIAGTSSNGGENADADEDLLISYSIDNGVSYTQITVLDAEDARFTGSTFSLVTLDIPEAAKTSNVILKFHQEKHSGSAFDQWGIEYVKLLESTTVGSSSGQVYDTIDSVDQGTVDQSAGVNEDYGTITIPFTNGIVDYGQLNPGLFKFGDLRISGGDSAHSNPRAYRGAIEHITEQPVQDITILPDDIVSGYSGQLINVTLSNSGTGLNNDGGFNIGRHVAFDGSALRGVDFTVDTRNYDEIAITCIRGNGSNGGEEPDANEDLKLGYSLTGGFPFTDLGVVLAENSTDGITSVVRKIITLPAGAKSEVVTFRLYQAQGGAGIDDYGVTQIEILSDTSPTPFNLDVQPTSFTLSGAAGIQFNEPATQVYTYGLLPNQASQGEFLKIGGGMSPIISVKGTYYSSGGLFNSGVVIEKTSFNYNDSSIVTVETPIDNGQITSSGSATDYGQVSEYGYGETNYGQVAILQTTQPFGKLFEWSGGDIAHANPVAYLGSTARIRISGGYSNLQFASQAGESTVLFRTSGGDANKVIKVFTGTGSLFHIGDRVERRTFSYNTSSIAPTDQFTDNGLVIHTAANHSDYGQIIHDHDAALSHSLGLVGGVIGDENPFGLYQFSGTADDQFFPTFAWNKKSAPIRVFNDHQDPADFRFTPHWRSRHLVGVPKISNGPNGEFNTYARTRPFIGEGRLFGLGDKVESATFRYTTESVVVVQPPENYGLITNTPTQNLDYGSTGSVITPGGEFDNGQVVITETTQALTGLYQFSGEGVTQFFRGPYVVKPTAIRIFNEQQDPADFRFMPHWRSRPYEQGKLTGSAETPRARDFVGEGRLFGLGDKVESATFRYTTESVVVVEPPENYGLITSTPTQNLDFGSVGSVITPDGEVDFGQVVITETTQSATGLYNFTGVGISQFFRGPYSGKGSISFYKGQSADTDFRFMPHWRGVPDEQFKVSGVAHTPRARDFVGSGSLFHIGDKIERRVYDYTTESIAVVQPEEDYGSITTTASGTLDYGSVGSVITPDGEFDNGSIVITQTTQPFGLFRFGGEGAEVKSSTPPAERFEISISGGAVEKVTAAEEDTTLFSFTGSLAEKFSKGNYAGSGSLFHIGDKIERVVFHYNTSSVGDSWGDVEDRGDITTTPTTNINNGLITDETVPPTIDYGFNIDVPGSERPFGQLFEITGGDSGHRQTFAEFSSGSLFGASGAAEVVGFNPPEETFLFGFSGAAVEKHVENYVGSGLIKYPEDTPLAPNAAVRFRPHWRSRHLLGTPRIHGNTQVAFKGAYVSKGVFSRMYTHDKGE